MGFLIFLVLVGATVYVATRFGTKHGSVASRPTKEVDDK